MLSTTDRVVAPVVLPWEHLVVAASARGSSAGCVSVALQSPVLIRSPMPNNRGRSRRQPGRIMVAMRAQPKSPELCSPARPARVAQTPYA